MKAPNANTAAEAAYEKVRKLVASGSNLNSAIKTVESDGFTRPMYYYYDRKKRGLPASGPARAKASRAKLKAGAKVRRRKTTGADEPALTTFHVQGTPAQQPHAPIEAGRIMVAFVTAAQLKEMLQ